MSTEKSHFLKRTGRFSLATVVSRIMGLLRETSFAAMFGAAGGMDAFVAAFRIPNLLRDLFAEGALSAAYVPVFTDRLKKEGLRKAFLITSSIFSILLVVLGVVVVVGIVLAPYYVRYYVSGFDDPARLELTILLTRIMFPFILLVAFAAVCMGTLNALGKFGIPALAPAMFNLVMIISALYASRYFDPPITALGVGAVAGGAGQFAIQLPQLLKSGFKFRFRPDLSSEPVRRILKLMLPAALGVAAWQINVVVATVIASFLAVGSISSLYYALRLMHFPLGVFGVALAAVSLPEISALVSTDDFKGAGEAQRYSSKMVVFLLMPSAAFLIGAAEAVVSLIYQRGNFGWSNTQDVALALRAYCLGLVFFGLVRVTAQLFYAFKDTATPVKISFVAVLINIVLSLLLMNPLGFAGLALATSAAATGNFALLYYFSGRKAPRPDKLGLWRYSMRILAASVLAGSAAFAVCSIFRSPEGLGGTVNSLLATLSSAALAGIVYLVVCALFRIEEISQIRKAVFGRE